MWKCNSSSGKLSAHKPVLRSHKLTCMGRVPRESSALVSLAASWGAYPFISAQGWMWRISVFLCYGGTTLRPMKQGLYLLCKADPEHWQGEPPVLLRLRFVAIGIYSVYLYQAGALAPSIPAEVAPGLGHLLLPQLGPCDSPGCCDVSSAGPAERTELPWIVSVTDVPCWQALGHPASCGADTLPWRGNRGRHKFAMGQWGSGCKHQRTAPVNRPVILDMKLLAKPTAFNQFC